jgi:hypothetical protein
MRKVTEKVCQAFQHGIAAASGNSMTDGQALYLHGNKIAEDREDGLYVTTAGWNSNTTRERLNGLFGVSVYVRKGQLYLNGKEWDGEWVHVRTWDNTNTNTYEN